MASDFHSRETLCAWLRLSLVPGVKPREVFELLRAFGSAEQVFTTPARDIAAVVGDESAARLVRGPAAKSLDSALAWLEEPRRTLLTWGHPCYPGLLLEIASPPPVLYARGDTGLLDRPAVAIVGSRNATAQGVVDAESCAEAFSRAGLTVVSGLALGIDAAAHRGALRGPGSSIAVVGTGADRAYPRRNAALADKQIGRAHV